MAIGAPTTCTRVLCWRLPSAMLGGPAERADTMDLVFFVVAVGVGTALIIALARMIVASGKPHISRRRTQAIIQRAARRIHWQGADRSSRRPRVGRPMPIASAPKVTLPVGRPTPPTMGLGWIQNSLGEPPTAASAVCAVCLHRNSPRAALCEQCQATLVADGGAVARTRR